MSGFGERFRKAGYKVPKPLIHVEKKPIIAHIVDMFPGENEFIFICNKDHLRETRMIEILKSACEGKNFKIIPIESHSFGPVYAVSKAFDLIDEEEPLIINYCDFTCYWKFQDFVKWAKQSGCDGAVPAYKGFHPHSLGNTNYAYIRESNNQIEQIKEKEPFTDKRMDEYASSGTYYFSRGSYVKKYFSLLMNKRISTNGEYYCSLVYNLMNEDNLVSRVYEIEHFMQWGTPEDVKEYNHWSSIFHRLYNKKINSFKENYLTQYCAISKGTNIVTMAGKGSRFAEKGYLLPKPLIPVNKQKMFVEAFCSIPPATNNVFAISSSIKDEVEKSIRDISSSSYSLICVEQVTGGQSMTAKLCIEQCMPNTQVTITSCDHAIIVDEKKLENVLAEDVDIIVWGFKQYYSSLRNPKMYGWVSTDEQQNIVKAVTKTNPSNVMEDYVITGTFTYRSPEILSKLIELQIKNKNLVNGEYYLDSTIAEAIKIGLRCKLLEVDNYICWGTPNELNAYEYWQSCFSKWKSHPYSTY